MIVDLPIYREIFIFAHASIIDRSKIILKPVTVTFLEMTERPVNEAVPLTGTAFRLLSKPIDVNEYREVYYAVGEKHSWLDRMVMPDDELFEKINADNIEIFIFYVNNEPAGYIEFIKEKRFTEILYFGIMPAFIGKGFGKYFLQWVINKAWSYGVEWIQLNTCTLDHPNALPNYKKAGFIPVRTEVQERKIINDR
jgi:GNAT superfamily N-acetyltransferase